MIMLDFQTEFEASMAAVPDKYVDMERFVPGSGPLDAPVMLVGEAPGRTEVEESEPFVGQAGETLDRVLDELDVDRRSLYITNVVKVRPPENRTPYVGEIDAWMRVLEAEIARVDPEVIVTLGNTATKALLDTSDGVGAVHGRRFERDGRTVVPTYHPAALFYDRSKRDTLLEDLRTAVTVH
jgi:DNA polymerase